MILSCSNIFFESKKRLHDIKVTITTDHPASSCGKPVIVFKNGDVLDTVSWIAMDFRVERCTKLEKALFNKSGLL